MTFLKTIPEQEAEGHTLAMYERQQGNKDYLPNYARVFCFRPNVMEAWANLQREIRQSIDYRDYELIVTAAALELGNSYCALAHSQALLDKYFTAEQLTEIASNPDTEVLTSRDRAMIGLAKQVVQDSSAITDEDIEKVRQEGFTEAEIFDIVAAAAARCFFAKVPDALGARPDGAFHELPENLKKVLVVGREVEDINETNSMI